MSRSSPFTSPTPPFVAAVLAELGRCVSEVNAAAVVSAAAAVAGVPPEKLSCAHLPALMAQVRKSIQVFGVSDARRDACLSHLLALCWPPEGAVPQRVITVEIAEELDIVRARRAGKEICIQLGFSEVGAVKVATAISELARNILKYAGDGSITIRPLDTSPRAVEVMAFDRGPGIPDIDAVLRPGFKSRTGMGAGLRGTRALMDHFDVATGPGRGTVVTIRKRRS